MIEPRQRFLDGLDGGHRGQRRTARQDDGEAERARRRDLAVGRGPTAVPGDDEVDGMGGQQCPIVGLGERSTAGDVGCVRHREGRIDRFDAAYEIMVLRRLRESPDLAFAEGEEDTAGLFAQRLYCRGGIGNLDPTITGERHPRRPAQRKQRYARGRRRVGRVGRDDCGVRMGRIDKRVDAFGREILAKALGATESADPHRHRVSGRRPGAARERNRYGHIGAFDETFRQPSRFRRAAQNEDVSHVVR